MPIKIHPGYPERALGTQRVGLEETVRTSRGIQIDTEPQIVQFSNSKRNGLGFFLRMVGHFICDLLLIRLDSDANHDLQKANRG